LRLADGAACELSALLISLRCADAPRKWHLLFLREGRSLASWRPAPANRTHRNAQEGNFRSRISEHYLLDDRKMAFDRNKPAPHDRSIFRKNIGRVMLNRAEDSYLAVWEIDFMKTANCQSYGHLRDLGKERQIETDITRTLRENFEFRFIGIEDEQQRLGVNGFERQLIATVAQCTACGPSKGGLATTLQSSNKE